MIGIAGPSSNHFNTKVLQDQEVANYIPDEGVEQLEEELKTNSSSPELCILGSSQTMDLETFCKTQKAFELTKSGGFSVIHPSHLVQECVKHAVLNKTLGFLAHLNSITHD